MKNTVTGQFGGPGIKTNQYQPNNNSGGYRLQESVLDYDFDSHAVSFANIRRIIGSFKYGHPRRLGFELLILTGMRESVMVDIGLHNFDGNIITFRPGKNQKGKPRRIALPIWFMNELAYYIHHNPHKQTKIFPFSSKSFERSWHNLRHQLGGVFEFKRPGFKAGWCRSEYLIQIKGIRKTYMVKRWYDLVPKFGKEAAVHVVANEMRHSSVRITMVHYLKEFENIELARELELYRNHNIGDIIRVPSQEKLIDDELPETFKPSSQKSLVAYEESTAKTSRLRFGAREGPWR